VTGVEATAQRVQLDDPPDAEELVSRAMGVAPYPLEARVRLPLGPEEAERVMPRSSGVHQADGDGTIVTFGGPDATQMTRYLAGLGVAAEVLGPPELREALRAHAAALASANGETSSHLEVSR
jgi:predicted DNA-binding transcriptional regulator YafY